MFSKIRARALIYLNGMQFLIDFILHIDVHLANLVNSFGLWSYALMFLIILIETGVVVLPFLPGDSLLFAAGALSANANNILDAWILWIGFFYCFLNWRFFELFYRSHDRAKIIKHENRPFYQA